MKWIYFITIISILILVKFLTKKEKFEEYSDIDKYADLTINALPESITEYQKDVSNNWIYNFFDECYVIYLDKRKNNMENLMKYLNINANFFSAIHKDIINRDLMIEHKLLDENSELNMGRIACHLSHLYVLQEFLKNDNLKTCLIFEDDIAIPKNLKRTYQRFKHALDNVPKDWDVINFGNCWDLCHKRERVTHQIFRSYRAQCRHCYAVSKNGARTILMNTLPMSVRPGDFSITALAEKGLLKMYITSPPIFFQNREEFGTNLGNTGLIQKECWKDHSNKLVNLEKRLLMLANNSNDIDYGIYYINSVKSLDKYNYMQSQFEVLGITNTHQITVDNSTDTVDTVVKSHKKAITSFVKSKYDKALIVNDNVCIFLLYINRYNVETIAAEAPDDTDIILLYSTKNYDNGYTSFQEYNSDVIGYIILKTDRVKNIINKNFTTLNDLFNSDINTYVFSPNLLFNSNYFKDHLLLDDNNPEEIESVSIINNILE